MFHVEIPNTKNVAIECDGNYIAASSVIGLAFRRFPNRKFTLASSVRLSFSSLSDQFWVHCLVVGCHACQIRYIEHDENIFPSADAILQPASGLWNSKVLLTAVTFDLLTTLGERRLKAAEKGEALHLHPCGVADFLDALVPTSDVI